MADRDADMPAAPEVLHLTPGVVLTLCPKPGSFTGVVTMVAARGDTVLVIDTGLSEHMPTALLPALDALGAEVSDITAIASTHGHGDHTGGGPGLHRLSGAPIHFCADDVELAGYQPHVDLRDGHAFDLGGLRFEVLATPGHTLGSLSFYIPERQLLIVGDAVQGTGSVRRLPAYYQSGIQYRASLRRMLDLPVDTLVLGHPLTSKAVHSYVFRGPACRQLLTDSLEAATVIEAATHAVHRRAHDKEPRALREGILAELVTHAPFTSFDPTAPVEHDTELTLHSELRDLGYLI
ncbi:MBL fold metallo-hydrolase [Micromonospora sp. CPCC 205539]|uniref:MBL fold metallo-hydrolase n=1 Tax=Micromonospora sp. CPCC 205539 TaxID=3122408 RepID=UPI002FF40FE0